MMPSRILSNAVQIEKTRGVDAALDVIYTEVDNLCIEKSFLTVDTLLHYINEDLSTDLILGILTITNRYKKFLPSRSQICDKVEIIFTQRGEETKALLSGLK